MVFGFTQVRLQLHLLCAGVAQPSSPPANEPIDHQCEAEDGAGLNPLLAYYYVLWSMFI